MFDISTKLVSEQDEISGLETSGWEQHSWKCLSSIGDERIIYLQRAKVYVFSDSVLCLGKIHQNPESNEAWEIRIKWITSSHSYRDFDGNSGEPTEFDTLQLCDKVKSLLSRLGETPEKFTGRLLFMSMFNEISCGTKDHEVWFRTMVIHWSRFRKEVVFYERRQSPRNLGQSSGKDVD